MSGHCTRPRSRKLRNTPGAADQDILGSTLCAASSLAVPGSGGEDGGVGSVKVRRVDFGYFVRPAQETGTGTPRVEPCLGYAVGHPEGMILFDTGMGSHPEVDAHYRPRRVGLREALAAIGTQIGDIR